MRYLCLVYQDERQLAAMTSSDYDALVDEVRAYIEEATLSGHYLASNALEWVESATSIRVRDDRLSITDGPFVETKEQLGGYLLIEARDLNEAIRVAARMPSARFGGIEIRPIKEVAAGRAAKQAGPVDAPSPSLERPGQGDAQVVASEPASEWTQVRVS
ncbi:MAG TPA: YciI family protein [Thermomicrobiales bacterium]|nr:YciI family protein [Thermomicrobiales bacterium]